MTTGIYKLQFLSGKEYVGKSYNIELRYKEHTRKILSGQHSNYLFLKEYHTSRVLPVYFILEALDQTTDETLNAKEIHWISVLDTYNTGFNLTTGGENISGEGSPASIYTAQQYYEVLKLLATTNNIYSDIEKVTGVHKNTINNLVAGRSQVYLKDMYPDMYAKLLLKKEIKKSSIKPPRPDPVRISHKGLVLIDPQGTFHILEGSQKDFAEKHGLHKGELSRLLQGKVAQHVGWTKYGD